MSLYNFAQGIQILYCYYDQVNNDIIHIENNSIVMYPTDKPLHQYHVGLLRKFGWKQPDICNQDVYDSTACWAYNTKDYWYAHL